MTIIALALAYLIVGVIVGLRDWRFIVFAYEDYQKKKARYEKRKASYNEKHHDELLKGLDEAYWHVVAVREAGFFQFLAISVINWPIQTFQTKGD